LLAAACIPILLLAAWMAYQSANDQRMAALRNARETVGRIGERITAEISAQIQVAQTLSLSTSLDQPDLSDFYLEAKRLKDMRRLWTTIELDDLNGAQLVNLLRPLGSPLGLTADRDSFDQAIRERRPVVGGIGPIGPVSGKRLVALRVPVMRGGVLRSILTVSMAPDAVGALIHGTGLPPGWVGAVADHRGRLIARNLADEDTRGRTAGPSRGEAIGKSEEGFYNGTTFEGVPVVVAFRALPDAGDWSVHLGIPSEELNGPTRHALYAVGVGVLVSLALAATLTSIVSRTIARERTGESLRAEAALAASEERAALAVTAAELGTWGWDVGRNRIAGSERYSSLLGLSRTDDTASDWSTDAFLKSIHPSDRERVRLAAQACIVEGQAFDVDIRTAAHEGEPRWLHLRGRAGGEADGKREAIYGIIADVGALKRAEAERRDLLRRLAESQEETQSRIARDLHDQVGQTVTGLSLGLKELERSIDKLGGAPSSGDLSLGEVVRWLQGLTSEIGRDLHRAAADLRPAALDDLGLPRALDALVADWSDRYGVATDVQVVGPVEPRLSREIQTVLYRVVQEALTNVLKHARARNVSIVMERRPSEVRIVIEDDGDGFQVDKFGSPIRGGTEGGRRPLGLSGMRERLAMVGGALGVESSPGAGSTLFVTVALILAPTETELA
jgi:two-component system sensor histidine kinase UhpB